LVMAVRAARHRTPGFGDAAIAGSVAFALTGLYIHAAVDCPLQILSLQFYAAIALGLGWSSGGWRGQSGHHAVTRLDTRNQDLLVETIVSGVGQADNETVRVVARPRED